MLQFGYLISYFFKLVLTFCLDNISNILKKDLGLTNALM